MNLDEAQRKKVAEWIEQGLKLSEIQTRLGSELGLSMTYMEVRMLVDDLKLMPRDIEQPKVPTAIGASGGPVGTTPPSQVRDLPEEAAQADAPKGGVSVTVDKLAIPGAVVSGKVTFSDGKRVGWLLDQSGRLGLTERGYRPPPADLQEFQAALDQELSRMGF